MYAIRSYYVQQVVSRNANPATPSVLSFGRFMANGATNVIPDKVEVAGTFRTLDDPWRDEAHKLIERIINHTAEAYGCRADITIHRGYPSVLNHVAYTTMAGEFAGELLGIDHVHPLDVRMTAEDFAYFSRKYPAVFYLSAHHMLASVPALGISSAGSCPLVIAQCGKVEIGNVATCCT